jgi:ferrochelatase
VDRDPGYIDQLRETADAVAQRAGLPEGRWSFAYQSAGHTPEEWLTPDVKDVLPELAERGVRDVLVVPLQFVADHLEILYDIDVAAAEEARTHGITLFRIEMPNTSLAFIRTLAAVVNREMSVSSKAKSGTP